MKGLTKYQTCSPSGLLCMRVWMSWLISKFFHTKTMHQHLPRCLKEPSHEIMALFVLHILFLQMHVQPYSGARCLIFCWSLPYFVCEQWRLCWDCSPKPSLVAYVISTIMNWLKSSLNFWFYQLNLCPSTQYIHIKQLMNLKKKFHFSDIHHAMNKMDHTQSQWHPTRATLTLHRTYCVHILMNVIEKEIYLMN